MEARRCWNLMACIVLCAALAAAPPESACAEGPELLMDVPRISSAKARVTPRKTPLPAANPTDSDVEPSNRSPFGHVETPPERVPMSEENGDEAPLTREEIKRLIRKEMNAEQTHGDDEESTSEPTCDQTTIHKPLDLKDIWNHGFVAESEDKEFRVHFGGRLDWDNAWFQQDENLLTGGSSLLRLEDGVAMRRARFRADGTVYGWIDFVTEVNFATIQDVSNIADQNSADQSVPVGSVGVTDFYLTFRNLPVVGNLRAGHFKAPLSLERYSSANVWYYMERSPMFDAFYGPNQRQSGLMLFNSWLDDRVTLAGSATRVSHSTVNSFGFDAEDGLYAAGVRATALPLYEDEGRQLIHVGVNYFRQAIEDHKFSIANRYLIRAGGGPQQVPNLVATGSFFTPDDANILSFEGAMVCGPFSLSSEYATSWGTNIFEKYNGEVFSGPRGDVAYHAGYVEGGLFVTRGDYRRFEKPTATWGRTIPRENARLTKDCDGKSHCGGLGAVQLLTRFSYLDLVSGSPTLTPTSGGARAGTQKDLTLGVNWYLNPQTIISVNYVWTHIESVVAGASGDIQGIGSRIHFDF